jgi:putative transposase
VIERKKRQSIRLPKYDYAQPGAYFVTIVTHHRKCFFGSLRKTLSFLSDIGRIVDGAWREIPAHFPHATVDEYVIMPNHIHGIVNMLHADVGAPYMAPLRGDLPKEGASPTLGIIIGIFKAAVT